MKGVAIALIVAVFLAVGLIGYGLFNTTVQVIGKGLDTTPAADLQGDFEALRTAVSQGSFQGTVFKSGELGDARNYTQRVYLLRIKNPGLVRAEMVELQIAPIAQDVLFYGDTNEIDIAPGETRDVWCVLLTEGETHDVRDIVITYYLWGHAHEVRFTYDNTI